MDCKVGDVVHVRRRVNEITGPEKRNCKIPHFNIVTIGSPYWVPQEDIVHVEPLPIAVGDTVRHAHNERAHHQRMHVNAIVDGRAWCRSSGYDYIIEVEKLERVL